VQDDAQQVVGATVEDQQTGRKTDVHARVVINATGPFADSVRAVRALVARAFHPNKCTLLSALSSVYVSSRLSLRANEVHHSCAMQAAAQTRLCSHLLVKDGTAIAMLRSSAASLSSGSCQIL
jgi:hypothetical protein